MCNRAVARFIFMMLSLAFAAMLFIACERLDIVKVAKIVTLSVENQSADTAVCYGNLIDNGGVSMIEKGICCNTSPSPTINNYHEQSDDPANSFSCILRKLQPGTNYYARAYTRNGDDITYGNDIPFKTKDGKPVITTIRITDITTNSALAVSTIENDGGSRIVRRGICWSLIENPTITDNPTSEGSGLGTFTSPIKGLNMGTYYYMKAYAINTLEVVHYGNQQLFRTVPSGIDAVFEKLEAGFAPIIDGSEEDLWKNVIPLRIEKNFVIESPTVTSIESPTVTAYWKGMYDDTCLYVLVNVEDDNNCPFWQIGIGPNWDYDRTELYFDLNDILEDGQGPSVAYSGHWQAPADIQGADDYTRENYRSLKDTDFEGNIVSQYQSYGLNGGNCTYEFRIPLVYLKDKNTVPFNAKNLNEMVFGFDITVTDWDYGLSTKRQRKAWMNNLDGVGNESWYNMNTAGKIVFR